MIDDPGALPADELLESVPAVLLLFGPSGQLLASSAVARRALGLAGEGTRPDGVVSVLLSAVRTAFENDTPVRIDRAPVTVGGSPRLFGFSAVPVRIQGRVAAVLVSGKDLTARDALDRELRSLEHSAQVEAIVGKVSHELRNPLNAIRGYAQFAALRVPSDDPLREPLSILVREVDRMDRMLTGLRDLGTATRLDLTLADPEVCLREALSAATPLLLDRGAAVGVDIAGPLPCVLHDPGRLHQVFVNLLKNAADAVPLGGNVTLRAGALGPAGFWAEVADDGPGVDPALGERIFDLFFTTKGTRGEGVGLAVCREIVSGHGGTLRLVPALGGGAVFRLDLAGA